MWALYVGEMYEEALVDGQVCVDEAAIGKDALGTYRRTFLNRRRQFNRSESLRIGPREYDSSTISPGL